MSWVTPGSGVNNDSPDVTGRFLGDARYMEGIRILKAWKLFKAQASSIIPFIQLRQKMMAPGAMAR